MNKENLNNAKNTKNDEFYTLLTDIEKELSHYKDMFVGKTIYCNCDNPAKSNFVKWFYMRFNILHLKRIVATAYNLDGYGYYWDSDFATVDTKSIDISKEIEKDVRKLNGNGDFRSDECIKLLNQADIVVTNPPFSLFREYVAQLMEHNKKFVIIGNQNAITYKEIFKYIKNNKLWQGYHCGDMGFIVPPYYEEKSTRFWIDANGIKHRSLGNICWFTNLDIFKRHENIILYKYYHPDEYPKYDNYDAINVDKVADIPCDYDGVMGVPITFLDKYNTEQFEIIKFRKGNDDKDLSYNGKTPYFRILIKKKK